MTKKAFFANLRKNSSACRMLDEAASHLAHSDPSARSWRVEFAYGELSVIADAAGIAKQTLSDFLSGRRTPSRKTAFRIAACAQAMGVALRPSTLLDPSKRDGDPLWDSIRSKRAFRSAIVSRVRRKQEAARAAAKEALARETPVDIPTEEEH